MSALDGSRTHESSVPVGVEPVAVAARTNTDLWVVNHLSDSVSIHLHQSVTGCRSSV